MTGAVAEVPVLMTGAGAEVPVGGMARAMLLVAEEVGAVARARRRGRRRRRTEGGAAVRSIASVPCRWASEEYVVGRRRNRVFIGGRSRSRVVALRRRWYCTES
jgi:hypothetical protein